MAFKYRQLLKTTAFRTALLYACVFSLISALGLGFIYWSTKSHIVDQVDARLHLEAEVLLKPYQARALPALLETINRRSSKEDRHSLFFYLLLGPDQRRLAGYSPSWMAEQYAQSSYATLRLGDFNDIFQVAHTPDSSDSWVRVLVTNLPGGYQLWVGRDLNDEYKLLQHTLTVILLVTSLIFLLALTGSIIMGRNTLRRIDAINQTAGAIMAGNFAERLPVSSRNNEFDQLSIKLNTMLERIELLLAGMRQVTDNVAHDLRKPLNRLRNRLEVTLLEARTEDEYRDVLAQGIHDADELLKTFNALLSIAQAEAGVKRNEWQPVDLTALVEDMVDLYGALAENKQIALVWTGDPSVRVVGNQHLLAQAIGNMLDNAVKYTPEAGRIMVWVLKKEGVATLIVADSGPGIPEHDRDRALNRFVRLDGARSLPGNGLGLSLVKAVAKLHGAELKLEDNKPGLRISLHFVSK